MRLQTRNMQVFVKVHVSVEDMISTEYFLVQRYVKNFTINFTSDYITPPHSSFVCVTTVRNTIKCTQTDIASINIHQQMLVVRKILFVVKFSFYICSFVPSQFRCNLSLNECKYYGENKPAIENLFASNVVFILTLKF